MSDLQPTSNMFSTYFWTVAFVAAATTPIKAVNAKRINSTNYAGIRNTGEGIIEATADITIPECTVGVPFQEGADYTSDGWVGIHAFVNEKYRALVQTGISCAIIRNGPTVLPVIYQGWTEWAPNAPIYFESLDFRPGDVVHAQVQAHSPTSATTRLINNRTGEVLAHTYQNQTTQLQFNNVEWITEAQNYNNPFNISTFDATYTPWRFDNAEYRTADGQIHQMSSNDQIDTYINGSKVAEAVFIGPGSLEIRDTTPADFNLTLAPFQFIRE